VVRQRVWGDARLDQVEHVYRLIGLSLAAANRCALDRPDRSNP
jgi:hypothetical protein